MATRVIERQSRTASYESAAFTWEYPKMAIHLTIFGLTGTPNLTVVLNAYNDLTSTSKAITDLSAVNPTGGSETYLFYVVDVVTTPTASGITDSHHAYIPDKCTISVTAGDSDPCEYAVDVQRVN